MKKKLLTAALSMVLCLGMSVTAMAAPSPNGSATENTPVVSVSNRDHYSDTDKKVVDEMDAEMEAAFKDVDWSKVTTQEQVTEINTKVYAPIFAKRGITLTTVNSCVELPIEHAVKGWNKVASAAGLVGHAYLIHVNDGKMEVMNTRVSNGYIEAEFGEKFSPFYLVDGEMPVAASVPYHTHHFAETVVEPTATTWGYTIYTCECGYTYNDNYVAPTSNAAATSTAVTSPKTAENAVPFVMAVAAVAAIGGAVVVARRKYTA